MNYWMVGLAVASTVGLVSLILTVRAIFFYIEDAKEQKSNAHTLMDYLTHHKIRSILALATLFVCSFQGIDTLLFWIPDGWSFKSEEGFKSVREQIALWLSIVFLAYLVIFLDSLSKIFVDKRQQTPL